MVSTNANFAPPGLNPQAVFLVFGQIYHSVRPLHPPLGHQLRHAQIYVYL